MIVWPLDSPSASFLRARCTLPTMEIAGDIALLSAGKKEDLRAIPLTVFSYSASDSHVYHKQLADGRRQVHFYVEPSPDNLTIEDTISLESPRFRNT
ncbi:hypothetical protein CEXT_594291 [Caerostris extrusa]|uniref:Uncharacterized protein n=1 Tax=Caerostris extrusa TaxID=172846 RepID=A0AAV4VGN8_CAEEX|nr:hypothetical protein CEXT_594291 [Caerostris extrusa]